MLQPLRIIPRLFTPFPVTYRFSKVLKLKPLHQLNAPQNLAKSIPLTYDLFAKIRSQSPNSKTTKLELTQPQAIQKFIQLIINIDVQQVQKYILRLENEQVGQILNNFKKINVIKNTVDMLIAQPEYTVRLKTFLTNFIRIIFTIFRKEILYCRAGRLDQAFAKNCGDFFNEYIILADLTDQLVIDFCLFMAHLKIMNAMDLNRSFFSNQKIMVDYMLKRGDQFQISRKDYSIVVGYVAATSVGQNYPLKYSLLMRWLNSKLSPLWYTDPEYNVIKIMLMYERLRFASEKMTKGMKYWMEQKIDAKNFGTVCYALNQLIKVKSEIYYGREVPVEYSEALKRITEFLIKNEKANLTEKMRNGWKKNVQDAFKYLIPTLYRASIWDKDFWMQFASWLQSGTNYKAIPVIDLYNIYNLMQIDKKIIPHIIIERLSKTYQSLHQYQSFSIQSVDLIKEYHKNYGDRMHSHYTLQQQICNNLRSVSKRKVTAQVLVRMFIVDIMIQDQIIVEINGFNHYIENEKGQKIPNLKSVFKKRIIQKLGHKFLEYSIEGRYESNMSLLKTINLDIDKMLKK